MSLTFVINETATRWTTRKLRPRDTTSRTSSRLDRRGGDAITCMYRNNIATLVANAVSILTSSSFVGRQSCFWKWNETQDSLFR